jgi:hypothetical protein
MAEFIRTETGSHCGLLTEVILMPPIDKTLAKLAAPPQELRCTVAQSNAHGSGGSNEPYR